MQNIGRQHRAVCMWGGCPHLKTDDIPDLFARCPHLPPPAHCSRGSSTCCLMHLPSRYYLLNTSLICYKNWTTRPSMVVGCYLMWNDIRMMLYDAYALIPSQRLWMTEIISFLAGISSDGCQRRQETRRQHWLPSCRDVHHHRQEASYKSGKTKKRQKYLLHSFFGNNIYDFFALFVWTPSYQTYALTSECIFY